MNKSTKVLLAIVTVWPFIYMLLFFLFIFSMILMSGGGGAEGGAFPSLFVIIFPLHILTMLLIMALTVFYMVNVFKNNRVEKDKKVLWAVVLFMGGMIAMPIYWYLYIWKDEAEVTGKPGEAKALKTGETPGWANSSVSQERESAYVPRPQPPDWRG